MRLFSEELCSKLRPWGSSVFLCTGRHSLHAQGHLEKLYSFLRHHGFGVYVFDRIGPDPEDDIVTLGARRFGQHGCEVLLAVGGGSAIDAAKAIAIVAANGGDIYDYKPRSDFDHTPFPVVAVPTTCGSGSEVTRYAVINNRKPLEKFTIKSDAIVPRDFLLDPSLLVSLPERQLIATVFDASTHFLEVLLFNTQSRPASVERCLEGLSLIFDHLAPALESRSLADLAALQRAAHLAGQVIHEERTGLPHTLGNKLSAFVKLEHGFMNAICLPRSLAYLEAKGGRDDLFEARRRSTEGLLRRHGSWKGSVASSLSDFYRCFAPTLYGELCAAAEPLRSSRTLSRIVEQTANDSQLFDISPKRLSRADIAHILSRLPGGAQA